MDDQKTAPSAGSGVVSTGFTPAPLGYYLSAADGDDPYPDQAWCFACGTAMAFHLRRRRGVRGCHLALSYAEIESLEHCTGCKRLVDSGELSERGVDDEFAYYVEMPPTGPSAADAQALAILLGSLWSGDPRYDQIDAWLTVAVGA